MARKHKDGAVVTRVQPRNVLCPRLAWRHRAKLLHEDQVWRPPRTPSGRSVLRLALNLTAVTGSRACRCRAGQRHPVWLNRDPIFEDGGINLFAFCENEPIGSVDSLGLDSVICVDSGDKTNESLPTSASGAQMLASAAAGQQKGHYDYVLSFKNPRDLANKLAVVNKMGVKIDALYILDHGAPGLQELGNEALSSWYNPLQMDPIVEALAQNVQPGGKITLMGCSVGDGKRGDALLSTLANKTGKTIEANTGPTRIPVGKPPKPTGPIKTKTPPKIK